MRKLACACFAFSSAIILANYILPASWLPFCAVIFALLGLCTALLRAKWLRGFVIVLFASAVGFGCFSICSLRTSKMIDSINGDTLEISAELLDYPKVYEDYCCGEILLCEKGLPKVKAIIYDNHGELANAKPGQKLSCSAKIRAANTKYGEKYDYYFSRGFYFILSAKTEVRISEEQFSIRVLPQKLRHSILTMADALFPMDTAPFVKSLTLGDKSDLYNDAGVYIALSRAGFMHTVAVSGMHIAFLIGILQLVLGVSRRSSIICITLVWAFVAVTGFGPSAVRAGFMQSILLFAPLIKRENDPITSLSAVLALILLFNPYAAASVSLQLSFAAMAGIILFSSRIYNAIAREISREELLKLLNYPIKILSCSLAVLVFTVPLSAAHFGYISLLSPITNILGLWAVSLCFCGAYAAFALGSILPALGKAAAWLVSWLARYIICLSRVISDISFSALYLNTEASVLWLVLTYILALAAVFSQMSLKKKILIPTALSALALVCSILSTASNYSSGSGVISALDVGQGQCITAFSGDSTVMIDCGGQGSFDNAGETAAAFLTSRGRGKIDALVLTHLHADHCNGVAILAEMVDIGTIIIPEDADDNDEMLCGLIETAALHGTKIDQINKDEFLNCGKIKMCFFVSQGTGNANERGLIVKLSIDEYDMLITGDASKGAEMELINEHEINNVELLIAGHHGSRYSSTGEFLKTIGADTAIISVGYNTYGHPTYETLERLDAYGYTIYRTDLNGTVEVRIRNTKGTAKDGEE